ncbi:efflux RND transporter periplasmic adaptor subunit [Desulfofundulus thermocisternus]|uniref:hypothetical protein n=1 Tax=Desulfofundulus thermocisternus TaxID=42471 RepID=UPI00048853EF|nr:hypothetical protein [Desulfofundulus thermocisternus]
MTRGQVLVVLNDEELKERLNQAAASVDQARAVLEQAEGALSVSRTNLEKAAANYKRGLELLAAGAAGQKATLCYPGGRETTSQVSRIYPAEDPLTRSTIVEVPVSSPGVRPGMSVEVSFVVGQSDAGGKGRHRCSRWWPVSSRAFEDVAGP